MKDNLIMVIDVILICIFSFSNIKRYKEGTYKPKLFGNQPGLVDSIAVILLIISACFISNKKYQLDTIFIATLIYSLPLIFINIISYMKNKIKDYAYCGILFVFLAALSAFVLIV